MMECREAGEENYPASFSAFGFVDPEI